MKKIVILFCILLSFSTAFAHDGIIGETLKAVVYICFGGDVYSKKPDTVVYTTNNTYPQQVVQQPTSQQPVNVVVNQQPNNAAQTQNHQNTNGGHWETHATQDGFKTTVWVPDAPINDKNVTVTVSK